MADFDELSSLESPKKRPRLETDEPNDTFTCPIERETSHLPTSSEMNSLHTTEDRIFEGKHLLNFDPESGAGFEHELPSDAANRDERVPTHFDSNFLPEQKDSCEHDRCLPCQASSSSPAASDNNVSPGHDASDAESEDDSSSGSGEESVGSLDEGDLDLGLGECELEQPKGPMGWLQQQMMSGVHPRSILSKLLPTVSSSLPEDLDEFEVWSIIADYFQLLREPPRRKKLTDFNTFEDALNLLRSSKRIMVLTGAGVSVSCGIPDFRSRDGVYARLAVDFPDLPDPQAIFDIHYFRRNPRPFFKFAKEIYPGEFWPSTCHKFIALLEQHGKLLRNFSQNIDTLEQVAGITKVLQCHGSFATAHCTNCNHQVDADAIRPDIFNQVVPLCPRCPPDPDILAVMKPDIVFFGEGLPKDFYHCLDEDKDKVDLLIVIGSSLKVQPVATIPNAIPGNVPQILINREPLNHMTFDIELLGDGDIIVNEICRRLGDGWDQICDGEQLVETLEMPDVPSVTNSNPDDIETMATPERPERGFEVADSTSWVGHSERRPKEGPHSKNDKGDVSQEGGSNSKVAAEQENSVKSEEAPENPASDPCRSSDEIESSNIELTNEVLPETRMTVAANETEGPHQSGSSFHQHREPVAQLHPTNGLLIKDSKPLPNLGDGSKFQENSGTQNCDISSTMSEDRVKVNNAESDFAPMGNAVRSEIWNRESAEVNEAQSQTTVQNEEAGSVRDSSKADGFAARNEVVDDGRNGVGISGILKTQDEASPSESRPKRKRRNSIALYLNSSSYLFVPPNRYIFHGAEVFPPSRPESPHAAKPDDNDESSKHLGDDNDGATHQAEFLDRSDMPSTSDALIEDLLPGDVLPKPESSAMHSGMNASHAMHPQSVDPVRQEDELQMMGNSRLHCVKDATHGHELGHVSLLMPENPALHAGKGEAVLPCVVGFR